MPDITVTGRVVLTKDELNKGVLLCVTENDILIESYRVWWKDD